MPKKQRQLIDLSMLSIVKFFLVIIFLIILYLIKDVLAILFIALLLASAFDPWVDAMQKIKIPRALGILLIYTVVFCVLALAIYLLIPPLVSQVGQLTTSFPAYFSKLGVIFESIKAYSTEPGLIENVSQGLNSLKGNLSDVLGRLVTTISGVFGGIISFFLVLVITFYLTVEESALKKSLTFVVPEHCQKFTLELIGKVQRKIGDWLKGQLILSLIIGLMVYIGLLILGVNYALILAFVAAIGEFIPYIGPVLSAVPAVFLAFTQSPIKALFVFILFVVIQQLENNLIVPKVMQKAVGLNPIVSISAMMIGVTLAGFVGILLAIPVATAISVIASELWTAKEASDDCIK